MPWLVRLPQGRKRVLPNWAVGAPTEQAIRRTLKPDGLLLIQDIAASGRVYKNANHSLAHFFYNLYTMHCMTVSLAQGGTGPGTMWGPETEERMLDEGGFGNVHVQQLPHDALKDYYACHLT